MQTGDAAENLGFAFEPVLDEANLTLRERLRLERSGGADDALHVFGELRFRPDDAVNAERRQAPCLVGLLQNVVTRHETNRARLRNLARRRS